MSQPDAYYTSHPDYDAVWGRARTLESEVRPVGKVSNLRVIGSAGVVVFRGETPRMIVLTHRREDLHLLRTERIAGMLTISQQGGGASILHAGRARVSADGSSVASLGDIHIHADHGSTRAGGCIIVDGVEVTSGASGASAFFLVGLVLPTAPSKIDVQGSGDVVLFDVDVPDMAISIAGSGDVTVHGRADYLDVQVAGSGDVSAAGLMAERARISVTGSGDVVADVSDKVDANVTGSGDIELHGSPIFSRRSITGSGDIRG